MESDPEQENTNNNQGQQNNKFLIKLKMPVKLDQEVTVGGSYDSTIQHVTNNTPRVCPQCNKEFGSGKALGGHMRIHAEAIKKQQKRQKMLSSVNHTVKLKNEVDNMGGYQRLMKKEAVCNLCGKKFPSMKSVYGHMRCHPERDYRGIQPPLDLLAENHHNLSSSEDDDDSGSGGDVPVSNLLAAIPKWGEKARRGQKGVRKSSFEAAGSSGVMVSEEEEDEEYEDDDEDDYEDEEKEKLHNAVNYLMLLKQVDVSESSGVSTLAAAAVAAQSSRDMDAGIDQPQEVSYGNSLTFNNREEEFGNVKFQGSGFEQGGYKDNMKRSFGMVEDEYDDHLVMEKEGGSNDHVIKNISDHHMGKEVNAAHHVVENHDVDDAYEYDSRRMTELMVMNNGGPKHFDWVNHKDDYAEMVMGSSKNKKAKKMKLMMDLDQEKPSSAGGSAQAAVSVSTTTEKYRCSTCNKSFSSHQALGGHRSSHNKFKLTIINADSGTNNQSLSVNADHHRVGNEEFDQKQHQLITSADIVNRMMSEECANKKDSTDEGAGSSKGDHNSSIIHQCEVCNKIFPTGQALGGHKRCHWTASADQTQSPPQAQAPLGVTSSGEGASTQTGGNHIQNINIDLNFPPPMDDDFEAQGGGGGAAEHATRLHL